MSTRRIVAFGALAVSTLFPIAVVAFQSSLGGAWSADRTGETIHFLNYRIPNAMHWFYFLAEIDVVWSIAYLVTVFSASELRQALGGRFFGALLIAQAFSLAVLVASPFPMDSDQFAYVYYGDLTLRGVNPYPQYPAPLHLESQEQRIAVHWGNPPEVDRYGSAWTLANAAALAPFRKQPAEVQAKLLRALAALTTLACTIVLARVLPITAWRDAALVAFALNPLILVAEGNGGHNDVYLLFFGLLASFFAIRRSFELAAASLATAVCIKFAYGPLVPALLAYTYAATRSVLRTVCAFVAFLLPVVLFSSPLGLQKSLIEPVLGWNSEHPSRISYFIWRVFAHLPHLHSLSYKPVTAIVPLCTAGVALAIALYALKNRRFPVFEITLAVFVLLLPYKLENWYAVMLVPLLLVQSRLGLIAFLAITLACQYLQVRMFAAESAPYVVFTSLAIIVAALLDEFLRGQNALSAPQTASASGTTTSIS